MSLITNLKPNAILDKSITKQKLSDDINLIFDNTEKHLTDIQHELTVTSNPILEEFTFEPHNQDSGVAQINSIHGNSVVWNQLVNNIVSSDFGTTGWYVRQGNDKAVISGNKITITFTSGVSDFPVLGQRLNLKSNRKYYIKITYEVPKLDQYNRSLQVSLDSVYSAGANYEVIDALNGYNNTKQTVSTICNGIDEKPYLIIRPRNHTNDVGETMSCEVEITDLTLMFGAGNEPTTVEEFESLYGNMPSEYNEGTIIDNKVSSIKSVGTNIWDEEWENGTIDSTSGNNLNDQTYADGKIRSTNYIKVLPNTEYYCGKSGFMYWEYDNEYNYIPTNILSGLSPTNGLFITSSNCRYIRFRVTDTKYSNDICINLSDESINGKYFPYEDFVRELPTIDGGLKSAGNVCDEIRYNVSTDKWDYIQRVGSVDLGTLEWTTGRTADSAKIRFLAAANNLNFKGITDPSEVPNLLSCKYLTVSPDVTWRPELGLSCDQNNIIIYDPTYTDTATFKEAMNGVILYYELAEPIVTELSDDYNLSYQISKCGTVEAISDGLSSPFKGKIEYSTTIANKINSNIRQIEYLDNKIDEISNIGVNSNLINVTYSELVSLRDNSQLEPGCWYRITDYVTTTSQLNTMPAGHQFDVLVLATDVNVLSEEARACKKQFNIEDFKDAYCYSWDGKMIYNGTYEYNGKIYYHYKSQNGDGGFEMLLDFNNLYIDAQVPEFEYPYGYYPTYAKYKTDENWEEGYGFGENIFFKTIVDYFASSNLNAWKIWYCLDNDESRFAWAGIPNMDIKATIKSDLLESDGITFKETFEQIHRIVIDEDSDLYTIDDTENFMIVQGGKAQDLDGNLALEFPYPNALCLTFIDYPKEDNVDMSDFIMDISGVFVYRGRTTIEDAEYDLWEYYWCDDDSNWVSGNVYYTTKIVTELNSSNVILPQKCGVIYRMIDEYGNDCPYDFKNIMFNRKLTDGVMDNENGVDTYVYTFNWYNENGICEDLTLRQDLRDDGGELRGTYNNIIKPYYRYRMTILNDIVFLNCSDYGVGIFYSCENNTFGYNCSNNTFNKYCNDNTFGNNCFGNTFGNDCVRNSFGNDCYNNSFGDGCENNTFGGECNGNTFGGDCDSNTFNNYCSYNSFGSSCLHNTFNNSCSNNTFGNNCCGNTFGNECYYNSFRMGSSKDSEVRSFCMNNIIENGVSHINLYNTTTASYSYQLSNIKVCQGIGGTSNSYKRIEIPTLNAPYQIKVAKNSVGSIKVYCEADLIGDDE